MCGYFCIEFINYMFDGKSFIIIIVRIVRNKHNRSMIQLTLCIQLQLQYAIVKNLDLLKNTKQVDY